MELKYDIGSYLKRTLKTAKKTCSFHALEIIRLRSGQIVVSFLTIQLSGQFQWRYRSCILPKKYFKEPNLRIQYLKRTSKARRKEPCKTNLYNAEVLSITNDILRPVHVLVRYMVNDPDIYNKTCYSEQCQQIPRLLVLSRFHCQRLLALS